MLFYKNTLTAYAITPYVNHFVLHEIAIGPVGIEPTLPISSATIERNAVVIGYSPVISQRAIFFNLHPFTLAVKIN